jgi:hypothetical protein
VVIEDTILLGEKNGMFGRDSSQNVKNKLKKLAHERFSGKTYEQIYGKEKSDKLKQLRRENLKGKNNSGKNNQDLTNKNICFIM